MSMRTFFALDIDEAIRDRLSAAQRRLDDRASKIKFVDMSRLHVTLKFLGDVGDDVLSDVCELAADIAATISPFDFEISGLQCVPPAGALRMLWAGVEDPTGRMRELYAGLDDAMGSMGFKQEHRAFRPHITLARVKFSPNPAAIRNAAKPLANEHFGSQHCTELIAYTSMPTPGGPVYTPISKASLGGRSD